MDPADNDFKTKRQAKIKDRNYFLQMPLKTQKILVKICYFCQSWITAGNKEHCDGVGNCAHEECLLKK